MSSIAGSLELVARIKVREVGTNTGLRLPGADHLWEMLLSMATGTSNSQSDKVWSDTRTLASTSEDLDLAGSLLDIEGNAITFAEVTLMAFYNTNTTSGNLLKIGGASSNQFINWVANSTDIVNVGANGILIVSAPVGGWAVTAGTGDKLKIDSPSATVTYNVLIVGRSS